MRGSLLLARRRLRRDAALVVTLTALVAFATVLAVAVPRLVADTVDAGAREEVAMAGAATDVFARTMVGIPASYQPAISPEEAIEIESGLPSRLPTALARVVDSATLTVVSPELRARTDLDVDTVTATLGMLTPAMAEQVRLVRGELPSATPEGEPVEVLVADGVGLEPGSTIRVGDGSFVVAGIVEPTGDASARPWVDLPGMWNPASYTTRGATFLDLTVLASPEGIVSSYGIVVEQFDATIRLTLDSERFSSAIVQQVTDELGLLAANSTSVQTESGQLSIRSDFEDSLEAFEGKSRGAVAQMSIMIAGVLGVCVIVVMQLSRLLVLRRSTELDLERARGASVASVGVRGLLESVLVATVGVGTGLVIGGLPLDLTPVIIVFVVALLASPVQAMLLAAAGTRQRRVHSDRNERADSARRRAATRIAIEFAVIALAAAALISIRSRGLLQSRTEGVDPLLAAAPILLGAAVTVVVLRVHPPVVRAVARVARRSRGVLGAIGAMQAGRSLAVIPMLALTLSIGLVVAAGLLVETVRSGQVDASWQRVGADVRVDGPLSIDAASDAAAEPGVTAASLQLVRSGVEAKANLSTLIATTLAVDDRYSDVLAELPGESAVGLDLLKPQGDSDPLPLLVSPELIERLPIGPVSLDYGDDLIEAEVVGTLSGGPVGYRNDPFIFFDLDAMIARSSENLEPNTLLIMGPGAVDAAPEGVVTARSEWLEQRQEQAFVVGVRESMVISAAAVALLAVFALVAAVQAGSRMRGRSLSLLRTLGLRARLGWWLAIAELAPVVVAALLGGLAAGVVIVVVCAPSLGLRVLAGGISSPAPSIAAWVLVAVSVGAVALLGLAMLTEVISQRRDRLSEVLRVGESG